MTQTKLFSLLLVSVALLYSGCSSTHSGGANTEPVAPPAAVQAEPVAEVISEPESEIVELVPQLPEVKEVIPEPAIVEPETLTILGFIKYVELEGGFFGIMTEDGSKFFPEYLEQDFKVDGLSVRVLAKPQEQILGIQMWGSPIEILKIEAN